MQSDFKYRVAARVGQWHVSRIDLAHRDSSDGTYKQALGYILHHTDVSSTEYVKRASNVGMSLHNKHSDKEIVYVNRYDWVRASSS